MIDSILNVPPITVPSFSEVLLLAFGDSFNCCWRVSLRVDLCVERYEVFVRFDASGLGSTGLATAGLAT